MNISISGKKDKEIKLFGVPISVQSDTTLRMKDNLQSCDQSDAFKRGVQTVVGRTNKESVETVVGQTNKKSVETVVGRTNKESVQTVVGQTNKESVQTNVGQGVQTVVGRTNKESVQTVVRQTNKESVQTNVGQGVQTVVGRTNKKSVQIVVGQTNKESVQTNVGQGVQTVVGWTNKESVQTVVGQTNKESVQINVGQGNLWSENEHKSFLDGLDKLGRGDWKGIAANFVPSRTPAQIASHAQKYFNRTNKMKRQRTSIFDIPHSHWPGGSSANVARTTFQKPPLAQENGPGIYQQSSVSSGSPTRFIAALCWISLEDYSSQSRDIHGFVVEPLQVHANGSFIPTTNNNANFLREMMLCDTDGDTNCDMNLEQQVLPDETNCDMNIKQVLPDSDKNLKKKVVLSEMDCDMNLNTTVLSDETSCDTNAKTVLPELMETNLKTDSMALCETDS